MGIQLQNPNGEIRGQISISSSASASAYHQDIDNNSKKIV